MCVAGAAASSVRVRPAATKSSLNAAPVEEASRSVAGWFAPSPVIRIGVLQWRSWPIGSADAVYPRPRKVGTRGCSPVSVLTLICSGGRPPTSAQRKSSNREPGACGGFVFAPPQFLKVRGHWRHRAESARHNPRTKRRGGLSRACMARANSPAWREVGGARPDFFSS